VNVWKGTIPTGPGADESETQVGTWPNSLGRPGPLDGVALIRPGPLELRRFRDPDSAWGVAVKPRVHPTGRAGLELRPEMNPRFLSCPYLLVRVEGGALAEESGNAVKVSETAQSGRAEGLVWAAPSEFEGGSPRGEQNTLRRSNLDVGEGGSVPASQEEMLQIQAGSLEGETEILRAEPHEVKEIFQFYLGKEPIPCGRIEESLSVGSNFLGVAPNPYKGRGAGPGMTMSEGDRTRRRAEAPSDGRRLRACLPERRSRFMCIRDFPMVWA
jgi:hypothetical protein